MPDPVIVGAADVAEAVPATDPPTERPDERAPAWFERGVVVLVALLGGAGLVGLGLGLLGWYRTWAALVGGVLVAAGAALAAVRGVPAGPVPRASRIAALVVLVVVGAATAYAAAVPSQNVVVTRDPGSYVNTALWLSRTGGLELEPDQQVFGDVPDLRYEGAGVYLTDGELQFQFNHLTSVLLAGAYDLGGERLLYRSPALVMGLGLLALYAVAVRVTRRPYLALIAPVLMAAAMPTLFVARNTYSEPFTLALLWGAVLVAGLVHRRPRPALGAVLGLLMGALVAVRVDALAYVALACPLVAISVVVGTAPRRRALGAWGVAAAVCALAGLLGWWDLVDRSGRYAQDLAPNIRQLRQVLAASLVLSVIGGVVWVRWAWLRRNVARLATPTAWVAAVAVVLVLLAGWLLRPELQTVQTGTPFTAVAELQRRLDLPIEPARTYYEQSLWWMAWYLGVPALGAAILGAGVLTYRFLRSSAGPWAASTLALCLGSGLLYWWNPSITPDHLWAMRRFVPAVLPSLCLLAVVAVVALDGRLRTSVGRRWHGPVRVGAGVLAAAVLLVPAVSTTWPLRAQRDQYGYLHPVRSACDVVGDDAALIVVGGRASLTLPQTLRSWCGVPVAAQGDAIGSELPPLAVADIATELASHGRQLFLVAENPGDLGGYLLEDGPTIVPTDGADDRWAHRPTLTEAPSEYRGSSGESAVPSPFQLFLLPVSPA